MGTVAKWALLLDLASREKTDAGAAACRRYAQDCLSGVPNSTQGVRYLGKFHVDELIALRSVGVPVCVHAIHEGWQYYLPAGRFHIFWNADDDEAGSLAHDVDDKTCCPAAKSFFSNLPSPDERCGAKVPSEYPESAFHGDWSTVPSELVQALQPGTYCNCGAILLDKDCTRDLQTPEDWFQYLDNTKVSLVILKGGVQSETLQLISEVAFRPSTSLSESNDWSFQTRCTCVDELVSVVRLYVKSNKILYQTRPTELYCDTDEEVLDVLRRNNERLRRVRKKSKGLESGTLDLKNDLDGRLPEWGGEGCPKLASKLLKLYDDAVTLRLALLRKTHPNAHCDSTLPVLLPSYDDVDLRPTVSRSRYGRKQLPTNI